MAVSDAISRTTVLVVSASPVNTVVVSRIVERMGLKAVGARPEGAIEVLNAANPGIVILDGGADDDDCDDLLEDLARRRSESGGALPSVLLLSAANVANADAKASRAVDMIIAKPLTVDRLQPAIDALRARNGDFASGVV